MKSIHNLISRLLIVLCVLTFSSLAQGQQAPSLPPPLVKNVQIYYAANGQQQGPVSMPQIVQLVANGAINGETLVWMEGMPNWVKASAVPQLAQVVNKQGGTPPKLQASDHSQFMTGTWKFKIQKANVVLESRQTYAPDGSVIGFEEWYGIDDNGQKHPMETKEWRGTWKVRNLSSKEFSLVLKLQNGLENINRIQIKDRNTLINQTGGFEAVRS